MSTDLRDAFRDLFGDGHAAQGEPILLQWLASPLGALVAGARDDGIVLLEFAEPQRLEQQLKGLQRHFQAAILPGEHPHLRRLEQQLAAYFRGARREFDLPLVHPGSALQQQVWQQLLSIPYGETRSYQQLAQILGRPTAARAVGTCNGLNRIAILIPCHRVVNKDGKLGGYGGGLWRKQRLLELERAR